MKDIVLDNSVLSAFTKIGRFELLREILKECRVYIADTVFREIIFEDVINSVRFGEEKSGNKWIIVERVDIHDIKEPGIGDGEAGTIKLALKKHAIAVIDDLDARKFATKHRVKTVGTLALLKNSYKKGMISGSELISILHDLETKDAFRMTPKLKEWILENYTLPRSL
ncbi:MAG: hypothetical protein DRO89_01485 [Candidatus Altiarchaeales archaeon]|nr:MAG: hypothetical protein DRO89_01485 [Candidatus Altiarchaeales archaeon]